MRKLLLSLILVVPLLTGCAGVNTELTINDDKSAEIESVLTYGGNLQDKQDSDALKIYDIFSNVVDDSYKTEEDMKDDVSTLKAVKSVKNLSKQDLDLSSLGFVSNLKSGKFVEVRKNFIISSYNIDMTLNPEFYNKYLTKNTESTQEESSGMVPEYYGKYGDAAELEAASDDVMSENLDEDTRRLTQSEETDAQQSVENPVKKEDFEAVFSVKIPSFASSNNADTVVGTAYMWNIKTAQPTVIKLQYVRYSGFAIVALLLAGVSLLLVMTKRIVKHETQKRMDNIDNIV